MPITTEKFVRKPLYVDAVRVTADNFLELAFWTQGSIRNNDDTEPEAGKPIDPDNQHIRIKVHKPMNLRQQQAHVGDWILKMEPDQRGGQQKIKIYNPEAFDSSFDKVTGHMDGEPIDMETEEPIETEVVPQPHEPTPDEPAETPHEPQPTEPADPVGEPVDTPPPLEERPQDAVATPQA